MRSWNARDAARRFFADRGYIVMNFREPQRRSVLDLVANVRRETQLEIGDIDAWQLYHAVQRAEKVEGDLAEVGVYKGGSAKVICEARGKKPLHLFDTFEGIPAVEAIDAPLFQKGGFAGSLEEVRHVLRGYRDVHFHPGWFPATGEAVRDRRFSFVNLDVDTYRSTRDAIEFFYPRLSPGGQILSHDYTFAPGVKKAFDEFFATRSEPIIELCGSQCLVVKVEGGAAAASPS
jgi:hypothetical protein